ncbi:hypothetical protein CAOG_02566 [Capsaspora owczarzaki ATCC 30864]|uniref:Uncharacterized protein n=1 Tax=Capsaspora owczarzaki (strain ATCC 30864) TaxID=595528 RepID=A0A0D2U8M4_CAPO3|nr:hypothetical protein CAOG_02566 [Capsaspora owczarzaki ATCC 30864]KJE91431.1 hypothetical protein CAOG_002566 [Capsaspora owczarzaki ATCC 30864]|eukprot:XP_004349316.2 hypothetical protein CAOG_02566 [Capsaspora owczarzaki ATCC 30864]
MLLLQANSPALLATLGDAATIGGLDQHQRRPSVSAAAASSSAAGGEAGRNSLSQNQNHLATADAGTSTSASATASSSSAATTSLTFAPLPAVERARLSRAFRNSFFAAVGDLDDWDELLANNNAPTPASLEGSSSSSRGTERDAIHRLATASAAGGHGTAGTTAPDWANANLNNDLTHQDQQRRPTRQSRRPAAGDSSNRASRASMRKSLMLPELERDNRNSCILSLDEIQALGLFGHDTPGWAPDSLESQLAKVFQTMQREQQAGVNVEDMQLELGANLSDKWQLVIVTHSETVEQAHTASIVQEHVSQHCHVEVRRRWQRASRGATPSTDLLLGDGEEEVIESPVDPENDATEAVAAAAAAAALHLDQDSDGVYHGAFRFNLEDQRAASQTSGGFPSALSSRRASVNPTGPASFYQTVVEHVHTHTHTHQHTHTHTHTHSHTHVHAHAFWLPVLSGVPLRI